MNRVFHKLDEIGNNANIGIRGMHSSRMRTAACWPYTSMHCAERVSARGCVPRGCVPRGACAQGVSARGVCPGVYVADTSCEQNDWQTGVKTLPCCNFVAGGIFLSWYNSGRSDRMIYLRKTSIMSPCVIQQRCILLSSRGTSLLYRVKSIYLTDIKRDFCLK